MSSLSVNRCIALKSRKKSRFISNHKAPTNEHYYRAIPNAEIDLDELKRDLDTGINLILDGIDSFQESGNEEAKDKILDGLFALTYQRYLMD
jgi:hypothetical protein